MKTSVSKFLWGRQLKSISNNECSSHNVCMHKYTWAWGFFLLGYLRAFRLKQKGNWFFSINSIFVIITDYFCSAKHENPVLKKNTNQTSSSTSLPDLQFMTNSSHLRCPEESFWPQPVILSETVKLWVINLMPRSRSTELLSILIISLLFRSKIFDW